MGRQGDGDSSRRGGRQPEPPPAMAAAYDPRQAPPPARNAKMKMESLIAAVDTADPMLPAFESGADAKSRRKRAKKNREPDEWAAPRTTASNEYRRAGPSGAISMSILNPAPPEMQQMEPPDRQNGNVYDYRLDSRAPAIPHASLTSVETAATNASVFHEMPVIQSFAETERRRSVTGATNGMADESGRAVSAPNRGIADARGEPSNGGLSSTATSRASTPVAANGLSVLEVFFPVSKNGESSYRRTNDVNSAPAAGNGRSMKRKRRGDTSSSRSGRRSGKDDDASGVAKYDLLRFDVDSVKLVPQGLVDRVEATMSRSFIAKVIQSHVDNWCRRSGFGNNFLSEVTTLLTAYYPCNYPTLLDEVLSGFFFIRPEYIDALLTPMISKYYKIAESVTSAKHPVIDAFARSCVGQGIRDGADSNRHSLACLTLLKCFVERNTEKFLMTPSIAACAVECSDTVLEQFWLALLSAIYTDIDSVKWDVFEPSQQVYELLLLDDKFRPRKSPESRRLCETFVRTVVFHSPVKAQVMQSNADLLQMALCNIFADPQTLWTTSLFSEWVSRPSIADSVPMDDLIVLLVDCCRTVSVQKTSWFMNHVLRYLLSDQYPRQSRGEIVRIVVKRYMPFLLGGASGDDVEFRRAFLKKKRDDSSDDVTSRSDEVLANGGSAQASLTTEMLKPDAILAKVEELLSLLNGINERTASLFLEILTDEWSTGDAVPWSYVRALVVLLVKTSSQGRHDTFARDSPLIFLSFCDLTEKTASAFFRGMKGIASGKGSGSRLATGIFNETLQLLLPVTSDTAQAILRRAMAALEVYPGGDAVFCNAVKHHLDDIRRDKLWEMPNSQQRAVKDAPVLGPDRLPLDLDALLSLREMSGASDSIGVFVRAQLSSRHIVQFLVGRLGTWQRTTKIAALLDIVATVVSQNDAAVEWTRPYVVQDIVKSAYDISHNLCMRSIVTLQCIVTRPGGSNAEAALWVVLRQCTRACCGCTLNASARQRSSMDDSNEESTRATRMTAFAELVSSMLRLKHGASLNHVVTFIEEHIFSCLAGKSRINLFLLTLLHRLVQNNGDCSVLLPVIQLAMASLETSQSNNILILQLQVLRILSSRAASRGGSSRVGGARDAGTVEKQKRYAHEVAKYQELVCSERVQSGLRVIGARSDRDDRCSRAAIELARGVLILSGRMGKPPM